MSCIIVHWNNNETSIFAETTTKGGGNLIKNGKPKKIIIF